MLFVLTFSLYSLKIWPNMQKVGQKFNLYDDNPAIRSFANARSMYCA